MIQPHQTQRRAYRPRVRYTGLLETLVSIAAYAVWRLTAVFAAAHRFPPQEAPRGRVFAGISCRWVPKMTVARHLAAIVAIDVDDYPRLMAEDEDGTHARLKACLREILAPRVKEHRGRVVKNTGAQILAEFSSVIDAVESAAEIQHDIADRNADTPEEQRVHYRIGINAGDVIEEPEDIYGDGVNIATRLEILAEPGGICISELVHDQVRYRLQYHFDDMGEQVVKNIARPLRVYALHPGAAATLPTSRLPRSFGSSRVPPRLSIVVLPFTNMSTDQDYQYFADGITEDLTTDLSRIGGLLVISRNTALAYRNRSVQTRQIGRELGVRYALEGSVRRSGEAIRAAAQLIDAETDSHLWAERYDRHLTDLFELQDEIVTAIAGAIEPELLKSERERIAARPQQAEDAYELYQRGMFHHYRQNKADNLEAQAYFRRALRVDPRSSEATAALSLALTIAAYLSWAESPDRNYEEALELGRRAVELDTRYPNSHFALALISMWTGSSDIAQAEFEEAIKLNPNFAAAHAVLGVVLTSRGRPQAGLASVEKGIRLSPRDPRLFIWLAGLAAAHYQLRHYSEAVEIGRRSWTLNRNYFTGLTYVVAGLAQLDRIDEARTALSTLRDLDPKLAAAHTTLERLYQDKASIDHLFEGLQKAGFK